MMGCKNPGLRVGDNILNLRQVKGVTAITLLPTPMRATYLGSSPLTVLALCVCGRVFSLDRARHPDRFIFRCDNCRSLVAYPSLVVVVRRAIRMENHDF